VWIANTVGLCNYKAFLLFLFYTFLACLLAAAMLLGEVTHFFRGLDTVSPEQSSRLGRCAPCALLSLSQEGLHLARLQSSSCCGSS
jgi:hypothetical protein